MSKGSRPRPFSVSQEEFGNNYDAIFGKKEKNMSKAIVWSKYNCTFCEQAKALLKAKGIPFEEKKILEDIQPDPIGGVPPADIIAPIVDDQIQTNKTEE